MIRSCLLVGFTLCIVSAASAQAPKQPTATSALCTRTHAIDNTKEQILFTRTFDRGVQRIAVLLRAADLLWPHDQERSVATFMEAFDLAVQDFKEQGDQIRRTSQSQFAAVIALPDQRFKVISALARRDPARARKLTEQVLDDAVREAADKPAADPRSPLRTAEKLLTLAHGLAADGNQHAAESLRLLTRRTGKCDVDPIACIGHVRDFGLQMHGREYFLAACGQRLDQVAVAAGQKSWQ